jgi:uncharacterized circularly permuted ATP-grasp superfamily protein
VRPAYADFAELLDDLSIESLVTKQAAAEELFRRLGITFAVYGEGGSTERLIPFDLMPRILGGAEWELVQRGCIQRVKAINIFLYDIYHDQEIIKAGLVPPEFVLLNPAYRPEMHGVEPPNRVYAHIAGIDLVRTGERDFFVLEDNVRTPSGVSYVLENREIMMRLFPDAFAGQSISPVGNYPERLLENLRAVAPSGAEDPVVVLLARPLQQRLFRACVPRRADGHRAGRGGRPLRARRLCVDAYHRRAGQGRRHLSPRRRFLHGPARLSL